MKRFRATTPPVAEPHPCSADDARTLTLSELPRDGGVDEVVAQGPPQGPAGLLGRCRRPLASAELVRSSHAEVPTRATGE